MIKRILLTALILSLNNHVFSQTQFTGSVIDAKSKRALAYVNIGVKEKNIGTVSKEDGSFTINLPLEHQSDVLTFSMVGYHESNRPIKELSLDKNVIELKEKSTLLEEVVITGKSWWRRNTE